MWALKLQIGLALLVLACGQIAFWRRRDNVLGYLAGGAFVSTLAVPLLLTGTISDNEPRYVRLYATVLSVGALAYLAGLVLGHHLGSRSPSKVPLTFDRPLGGGAILAFVERRARLLAAIGVGTLVAGYLLLGYVPLTAADRSSAKYGIGAYQDAYVRAAPVYLFALALSSTVLPVMLALYRTRRRPVDLVLAGMLGVGLLLSLSRDLAFTGPLIFVAAIAVERRVRPVLIVAATAFVYIGGAVFNGVLFPTPGTTHSAVDQIALSAPDVNDGIAFLDGFHSRGGEHTKGRTILAGLSPTAQEWDPSDYALRTRTGLDDVSLLAAGGIRLPAPIWGYASFGMAGVVWFCVLSGAFVGWATGKWKRLLGSVRSAPNVALNLTIAVAVYEGTFGLLAAFYEASTGKVLTFVVALLLGVRLSVRLASPPAPVPPAPRRRATGPTPRPAARRLVPTPPR
jgi:hypothetical protein